MESRKVQDNDKRGVDFAFIHLRPGYVMPIRANGVVPFAPRDFFSPNLGKPIAIEVVGFPEEEKRPAGDDGRTDGSVRSVLVWVEPCDPPDECQPTTYPRFFARMPFRTPEDAAGLSGGPVVALVRQHDDTVKPYLIGVQSGWFDVSRILFICPMSSILQSMLDDLADSHSAYLEANKSSH